MANKDKLSINEEIYCQERVNPLNYNVKSTAFRKAFPKSEKWKQKTIHEKACRLDKLDKIKTRIKILRKQLNEEKIASIEEILVGLTMESRFDPRKLMDEDGNYKRINDLDAETALCLMGYEEYETTTISEKGNETVNRRLKYKFPEKNKSRDMMARYHGLFEKDNKQKGQALTELTEEIRKELLIPRTAERVADINRIHDIMLLKDIKAVEGIDDGD